MQRFFHSSTWNNYRLWWHSFRFNDEFLSICYEPKKQNFDVTKCGKRCNFFHLYFFIRSVFFFFYGVALPCNSFTYFSSVIALTPNGLCLLWLDVLDKKTQSARNSLFAAQWPSKLSIWIVSESVIERGAFGSTSLVCNNEQNVEHTSHRDGTCPVMRRSKRFSRTIETLEKYPHAFVSVVFCNRFQRAQTFQKFNVLRTMRCTLVFGRSSGVAQVVSVATAVWQPCNVFGNDVLVVDRLPLFVRFSQRFIDLRGISYSKPLRTLRPNDVIFDIQRISFDWLSLSQVEIFYSIFVPSAIFVFFSVSALFQQFSCFPLSLMLFHIQFFSLIQFHTFYSLSYRIF